MLVRRYWWVLGLVVVIAAAGGAYWWWYTTNQALAFYSGALKAAHISTSVSIGGTQYQIKDGAATKGGTAVWVSAALPALRLAYAQAAAERHPVLDLSGVDPKALATAAARLPQVESDLASMQASSSDASLVGSLYPVHYLADLGPLEQARQAFITSGSDMDEQSYEQALAAVAAAGAQDISAFTAAFNKAVPAAVSTSSTTIMPSLGGAMTLKSLDTANKGMAARLSELSAAAARFAACADGDSSQCDSNDLALPAVASVAAIQPSAQMLKNLGEVSSIEMQAVFTGRQPPRLFALASSTCMGALQDPYYFLSNLSGEQPLLLYANDLYFYRPEISAKRPPNSYTDYVSKTFGISYINNNPAKFYECPDAGADYGRIVALGAVADFAQTHPDILPALRASLAGSSTIMESDAAAYLRGALAQEESVPDASLHDIIRLANEYNDRAGGLSDMVSDVVNLLNYELEPTRAGVKVFGLSVQTLYMLYGAPETFFLTYNPTAGQTYVSPRASDITADFNLQSLWSQLNPYSILRQSVPRSVLLHDFTVLTQVRAKPLAPR